MREADKLYIQIELGAEEYKNLGRAAECDILDCGIDCTPEDVYEIIYECCALRDKDLYELLNNKEKSMLYPLDCFYELSYEKWIEYSEHHREIEEAYQNLKNKIKGEAK
tara:strand:+ start:81 stop:407 length:327 start_codon:yes stop_codon:yes gene_type:complete